jgi:uncharacterized protein YbjT (DUF2867 family)
MKVVLAGGTGALGRRLADDLAGRGDEVVVLTRSPRGDASHRQVRWDGATTGPWAAELEAAALVNLAGELVDRRPTRAGVGLLTRSRVEPTTALAAAAAGAVPAPTVWVQMSTLAIYGDAGERVLDETAPPADGPPQMAGVARAWEHAAAGAAVDRQVVLRTGIVLDRDTRRWTVSSSWFAGAWAAGSAAAANGSAGCTSTTTSRSCAAPWTTAACPESCTPPAPSPSATPSLWRRYAAGSTVLLRRPHPPRSSRSAPCCWGPTRPWRSSAAAPSRPASWKPASSSPTPTSTGHSATFSRSGAAATQGEPPRRRGTDPAAPGFAP